VTTYQMGSRIPRIASYAPAALDGQGGTDQDRAIADFIAKMGDTAVNMINDYAKPPPAPPPPTTKPGMDPATIAMAVGAVAVVGAFFFFRKG
jgi:hypothetical protein